MSGGRSDTVHARSTQLDLRNLLARKAMDPDVWRLLLSRGSQNIRVVAGTRARGDRMTAKMPR
jgi:hypothetical protein